MGRMKIRKVVIPAAVAAILALPATREAEPQVQTYYCPPPGFGEVAIPPAPGVLPFIPLASLGTVPNPVIPRNPISGQPMLRDDLAAFIADLPSAIRLGKALFWDMQAGSDNRTACATCHFHAGADRRARNQVHPGPNGSFDGFTPNDLLSPADFPFTAPAADRDDVAGSQGVRKSAYLGIGKTGAESTAQVSDPLFSLGGKNLRQVTGINAPTVINAVFNHRNFLNGRAQPDFNGVNPWGRRDISARVWKLNSFGFPALVDISVSNASLASQAVGPALNTVEMSAAGRTFPDLGKKLLLLKPLGLQAVASTDSVLGGLADTAAGKGLKESYGAMIRKAFRPEWWNYSKKLSVNGRSYTMMEANFSLYWGLSVMLYEATLVADDTPMDRYLATRARDPLTGTLIDHDPALLSPVADRFAAEGIAVTVDEILDGLSLFELPLPLPGTAGFPAGTGAGCSLCHVGAETTSASLRNLTSHGLEPGDTALKNAGFDLRLERMFMTLPPVPIGADSIVYDPATYAIDVTGIDGAPADPPRSAPVAVYDAGWYNIGVRPTTDDPGVDGTDPFGNSLSWTRLFQAMPDPSMIDVPGGGLGCAVGPPAAPATSPFAGEVLNPLTGFPLLSGPLLKTEATDVAGAFKVPGLRNVELAGPYFHNGGKATLRQVVEFYDGGGDFHNPTLAPLIRPLGLSEGQTRSLVAFLLSLTDERVRYRAAPFDHPQLLVPEGEDPAGADIMADIPATGAGGSATPYQRFLDLNPFQP